MLATVGEYRERPAPAGALWLGGIVVLLCVVAWFVWQAVPWGGSDPAAACPYTFCGIWAPR